MRPFFNKESLWAYPVFAAAGGSFGYWLTGVQQRQNKILTDRRNALMEKRKRRAEREEAEGAGPAKVYGAGTTGGGGADMP